MKKKILIVGKKGFIGSNLSVFFKKKKIKIKNLNFKEFIDLKQKSLKNFDYIINCSIHKSYTNKKYNNTYDFDYLIARKILKLNCKLVFLSSRRVYKPAKNITEKKKLQSSCFYSKNKIITEKKLISILNKRVLILRISNLIGLNLNHNRLREVHDTFINIFIRNIRKNYIYDNKEIFKDFLSIDKFCIIVEKLINSDASGVYNVSIGQKIFLNKLISWLNYYNPNSVKIKKRPKKFNIDSFYLNNNRLKKKINIKIQLNELEKYCKQLSKKIFKKK